MGNDKNINENELMESEENESGTVFDDVFRTIIEKMPELVIPVINEVFHMAYDYDEKITYFKNEHQTKNGKVITDSCIGIKNRLYHIECQSNTDNTMTLRMIEYDFAIALEHADKKDGYYEMEFPKSCVLYLRHNSKTPDILRMKVKIPDGSSFDYNIPIMKVQRYTKDEIFQKRLLMFLPFYIMRYEKEYELIENEPKRLREFVIEYEDIRIKLDKLSSEEEKSVLYGDLKDMIAKIADHMLEKRRRLKERIGDTMRGQVLELLSERFAAADEKLREADERLSEAKERLSEAKDYEKIVKERESHAKERETKAREREDKAKEREDKAKNRENFVEKREIELAQREAEIEKNERKIQMSNMQILVQLINSGTISVDKACEMTNLSEMEFMATMKELGLVINS